MRGKMFLSATLLFTLVYSLPPPKVVIPEAYALFDLVTTFPGLAEYWNDPQAICSWPGIQCSCDGHIWGIQFPENSLEGTLPNVLSNFVQLRYLVVSNNRGLVGCLPPFSNSSLNFCDFRNTSIGCGCQRPGPSICSSLLYSCPQKEERLQVQSDFYTSAIIFFCLGAFAIVWFGLFIGGVLLYRPCQNHPTRRLWNHLVGLDQVRAENRHEETDSVVESVLSDINGNINEHRHDKLSLFPIMTQLKSQTNAWQQIELFPALLVNINDPSVMHFNMVESRFYKFLSPPTNAKVLKVDYLVNPFLNKVVLDLGAAKGLEPTYAWYGPDGIEALLEESYRVSLGQRPDKAQWSKGVVFSINPPIQMPSSTASPMRDKFQRLLLCQVVLDNPCLCDNLHEFPDDFAQKDYHSLVTRDMKRMAIFSPFQVLPTYVVYVDLSSSSSPIYSESFQPDNQKRKATELRTTGRILTTNYLSVQTNAQSLSPTVCSGKMNLITKSKGTTMTTTTDDRPTNTMTTSNSIPLARDSEIDNDRTMATTTTTTTADVTDPSATNLS